MTAPVDVLADLRGVVRIAKAASFGVSGNAPRSARAEAAIAAVAELIEAAGSIRDALNHPDGVSVAQYDALCAALAGVQGGAG